ncbi:MAG: serine/threonine-protein phosphatase [Lachnospiraceae bacterium]|nr:serine/threonine-protein phosphatase [Lachnospiraceae bacterium]
MNYLIAAYTDVGIKKKTNQDSLLVETADTDQGPVLLGVICDGMGGLAKGEVASAILIKAFQDWFHYEFPQILYQGMDAGKLRQSWTQLILDTNVKIANYGFDLHVDLGTTVVALLIVGTCYYIINVGDSRVYQVGKELRLLTRDQTYVQREMDMGRMTQEEASVHPQRNMLLQCVGASNIIEPDFYIGDIDGESVFMLCSDGFRHIITPQEFYQFLNPDVLQTEDDMKNAAVYLTELNKQRREVDNISVALIRTF